MWGANKWTDHMFRKYWWIVLLLAIGFIIYRTNS
jgi:hypothetical protein